MDPDSVVTCFLRRVVRLLVSMAAALAITTRVPPARHALLAIGLATLWTTPIAASASPAPGAAPASTVPSRTPAVTTTFRPRFEYVIPATMEPSAVIERSVVFGIVEGAPDTAWGHVQEDAIPPGARGVIVADVNPALRHPCGPGGVVGGPRAALPDGPDAFLEAMQTKAGLVLEGWAASTLDGRPAVQADFADSICGSADIHFKGAPGIAGPSDMNIGDYVVLDLPSRIMVAQVGGSTILVETWARTPEDLEAWLPIAGELIDSIHFWDEADGPSSSPTTDGSST